MIRIVPEAEFSTADFGRKWDDLLLRSKPNDLGQTHAWNLHWWRRYSGQGPARKELFLLAGEEKGRLDAVWPMFVSRRYGVGVLRWIGSNEGMITDYMGPLLDPKDPDQQLREFVEFLAENKAAWDGLSFELPDWGSVFPAFARTAVVHGAKLGFKWKASMADHSVVIRLGETFDQYLSSLGKKTRAHLRQYLREAAKRGALLSFFEGDAALSNLDALIQLNLERWEVFRSETAQGFLKDVVRDAASAGLSPVVVSLQLDGRHLAMALCWLSANRCVVHSAGVTRDEKYDFSPGTVMYALLAEKLLQMNIRVIDFGPGLEEYKLRLGGTIEDLVRMDVWHSQATRIRLNALELFRSVKGGLRSVQNGAQA